MDRDPLQNKRVAILATDGVEFVELAEPRHALEGAGAHCDLIAPHYGKIKTWVKDHWGQPVPVDLPLFKAHPDAYDALLLPGGVMNPDKLRTDRAAVAFVRAMMDAGKPVAAICHGPWLLVEADVVRGRILTSWPSLRTDIVNAGGEWQDKDCVTDRGLVTSRQPADIPAFTRKMIEEFAEGVHEPRAAAAVNPMVERRTRERRAFATAATQVSS
jgi:protease I